MTTLVDVGEVFLEGFLNDTLTHHGVKGMHWGSHALAGKSKGVSEAVKKEGKSAHLLTGKERAMFNKNHPNVKKGYLTNAQRALFYKNHPHAVVGKKIAPGAGHKGSHAESGGHKSAGGKGSHENKSGHKTLGAIHIKPPGGGKKSVTPGKTPHASGSHTAPVHADAQRHAQLQQTVQQHGTKALSNDDLKALTDRMRLLQQHNQLTNQAATPSGAQQAASEGKKLVLNAARSQGQSLVNKGAQHITDAAVQAIVQQVIGSGRHRR